MLARAPTSVKLNLSEHSRLLRRGLYSRRRRAATRFTAHLIISGLPLSADGNRDADLRKVLFGLPPGERLPAVVRLLEGIAAEDRAAAAAAQAAEELRRKFTALQDETAQLRLQLAESQSEQSRLAARLKGEEEAARTVQNSLQQTRTQLAEAQKRVTDRDAEIEALRRDAEAAQRKVDEARLTAAQSAGGAAAQEGRVAELQRRVIELQQAATAREAEFATQLAEARGAAGAARETGAGFDASGVPVWLATRIRDMKIKPVLETESVDQPIVVRLVNLFELMADAASNVNELVCYVMRRRVEDLPQFKEQCQAYLNPSAPPLGDLIRNAMSPKAGAERIVQQRLRVMQQWLRAALIGTDAVLDGDFVYKTLREFLTDRQREWRTATLAKFATELNGPALIARELAQHRGKKIAETFESMTKGA